MYTMGCVFCEIAGGESKAYIVYEDADVMAFLDAYPVSTGHTLIVSKKHYESILDIPKEMASKVAAVSKELAVLYKTRLGATGFNTMQSSGKDANQTIMHYHMHLVPRYKDDGLSLWLHRNVNKEIDVASSFKRIKSG